MVTTAGAALAAAAADTALMRLLWVGDSFLEGEGASTLENTARFKTVAGLRSGHGIKGAGYGLLPARGYATYLTASASWRAAGSSGTATTAPNWNITQGLKGVRFTGASQYRQSTLPDGTAVDVMYLQAGGSGGGNVAVSINGAAQPAINTNEAGQPYQPSLSRRYTRSGGRGALVVRATGAVTNAGVVDGFVHYDGDDTGGGLIAYDCTRTGAQSNVIAVDDIANGWAAIQPHLVIDDQVGSNDYLDSARAPAAVVTQLNGRLDKYASLASAPTVVILVPWRLPATAGTNALGYTYEQYVDAAKAACASHAYTASIKILDLQTVYPTAASQPWHDADGLHPNNTGHQQIANALVSFIDALDMETLTRTAIGTLTLSGSATASIVVTRTASGSLALGGSATGTASGGTVTRTATGGLSLGGSAEASASGGTVTRTASGGLTLGGTATATVSGGTITRTAAGTLLLSGFADPSGGVTVRTASGTLVLGGSATADTGGGSVTRTALGTIALGGTAAATVSGGTLTRTATATMTLTGTATWTMPLPPGSIRVLSVTRRARPVSIERRARTVTITQEAQ